MKIGSRPAPNGNPWGNAATPYEEIGGDEAVRALVDSFYDRIRTDSPTLRAIHPADDSNSRRNLYEYLSGWLGGPDLYTARKGHPRLRMRHLPFAIGSDEASEWMRCMRAALEENVRDPLRSYLEERFSQLAQHMQNQ